MLYLDAIIEESAFTKNEIKDLLNKKWNSGLS